ncbi:ATP-grasp domain-containing protein [Streptomyces apocyni]|uniref:ATP-grasp domain-containing protein n=1 Tax=Streptomyces apocyni TaxID=2654677 RepID=UPI0012E9C2AD|nr:ATP-grasp domain-containing protein [Streptomyces apocyni]
MAHVVFVDSTAPTLPALETAKEMGHFVTFIRPADVSLLALSSLSREHLESVARSADQAVVIDHLEADLLNALRRIHAERRIDALLTTSEPAVIPTVKAAETLGIRATSRLSMETAVTKDLCRDSLQVAGVRSARHRRAETCEQALDASRSLGLPLVIKPSRSAGKEGVAIIRAENELAAYFDELPSARQAMSQTLTSLVSTRLLMEEYIEGVLYSAEIIANDGEIEVFMIARREQATNNALYEVAAVLPAGLADAEQHEVKTYMQEVFARLGLTVGVYHVEFIMGADGPVLVEVNGRIMGGMAPFVYRHITGVNPFRLLIQEHLGEKSKIPQPPFRSAGISIALGSVSGGVLPDGVERQIEKVKQKHQPLASSLDLSSGQRIPKQMGNFTVFGFCCLPADTTEQARARGLEFISDLENAFGFDIAKYEL